jgi:predicted DNA binding CopG/RHH family protein
MKRGVTCIVLPMPDEGINYQHSFTHIIHTPLSPIDWYSLIKYSRGYIGENMHPIVTCLHNAVPCYSIDNWGTKDFFRRTKNDGSSKVEDIMKIFGVSDYRSAISRNKCEVSAITIVNKILKYPIEQVKKKAEEYYLNYNKMMENIIKQITL